jgi:hypothetical protein
MRFVELSATPIKGLPARRSSSVSPVHMRRALWGRVSMDVLILSERILKTPPIKVCPTAVDARGNHRCAFKGPEEIASRIAERTLWHIHGKSIKLARTLQGFFSISRLTDIPNRIYLAIKS